MAMLHNHAFAAPPPAIAPAQEVKIETNQEEINKPFWKKIWDQARKEARANELWNAKQSYNKLFKIKPNIAEARWEYCKLLILLNEWGTASRVLEGLIEIDPDNLEYLVLAGEVELKNKRFKIAVKYFGQVYEGNSLGKFSNKAIKGLIEAFKNLGNEKSAYLLLEQRFQTEKENKELLDELAVLSQKLGYVKKARFYYATLVERFSVEAKTVFNAALVHDHPGYQDKAAYYWKKYLTYDDGFLSAHEKLSKYYTQLNRADLALPHLMKIYSSDYLSTEVALQIGTIYYRDLARPDKGLFYYEQYNKVFPDDSDVILTIHEIRNLLAQNYLPIVENDGVSRLWDDLDRITADRKGLFLSMAELLKQQDKIQQEATVLEILFENDQQNLILGYRLANLYCNVGSFDEAYKIFLVLEPYSYADNQYLLLKAYTEQKVGKEKNGLLTLLQYLKNNQGDSQVRENAIGIAGKLGLVSELQDIWSKIPTEIHTSDRFIGLGLTYIDALRANGLFSFGDDVYVELKSLAKDDKQIARIQFHNADTLYEQELVFDAEQAIRQILAKNIEVTEALQKLIRLSISEKQFSWARSWLYLLATRYGIINLEGVNGNRPESLQTLNIQLLLAEEEYEEAEETILRQIQENTYNDETQSIALRNSLDLYLVKIYFYSENYEKCLQKIEALKKRLPESEELFVLKDIIEMKLSNDLVVNRTLQKTGAKKEHFSRLIKRAKLYYEYGNPIKAIDIIRTAQQMIPESVSAKFLEMKILSSLSLYTDALKIVSELASSYPEQEYFTRLKLQLEFKSGNFSKIVKSLPVSEEKSSLIVKNTALDDRNLFFEENLLLARSLWAENRREEAITIYNSLLAIPVDSIFLERVEVENINFHLPPLKKSFWNFITFTNPPKPDPITTVMDPLFVGQNIGQPIDDIAASLYGKYRWQKLIKKELSARQATKDRDFYKAEKEYRSLIKEEKTQETLFDLATIYNRFGKYGKEAELYELMKKKGHLHPELDLYIQSNTLKRQPRISSTFFTSNRFGRDGYINLKKKSFGFDGWIMPSLDQEVSLSVSRNRYSSKDNSRKSESNRFVGTYSTYYEDKFDMNISAGSDNPTDSSTSEILLKFEMMGRFNDFIQGYGVFKQDLVEDTMIAISDSVTYRDLNGGLKIDLFPRLFLGGDYRYRMYSDDNKQNYYKIWSLYNLFGEVNQFKLKYSYENVRNSLGEQEYKKAYWSPTHYWQHLFTFQFKHLFANEYRPESPLSYCTLEYSYGYETDYKHSHAFDVNIFLEINRHFLLKGNFTNINGEDYKETEAALSLIYRW